MQCSNAEDDKMELKFDGDKWYDKLQNLLEKGLKWSFDVTVIVSFNDDQQCTIIDADLDTHLKES